MSVYPSSSGGDVIRLTTSLGSNALDRLRVDINEF